VRVYMPTICRGYPHRGVHPLFADSAACWSRMALGPWRPDVVGLAFVPGGQHLEQRQVVLPPAVARNFWIVGGRGPGSPPCRRPRAWGVAVMPYFRRLGDGAGLERLEFRQVPRGGCPRRSTAR